ncbi:hypothetical protein ACXR2T_11470 [Leucobacter sp. HY1910]
MKRSGYVRLVLAAGLFLGAGSLLTAAVILDVENSSVFLDGSENRLNILTAGAPGHNWQPGAASWVEGNPAPFQISLTADGSDFVVVPGETIELTVAVKNASPKLAGKVDLKISDPHDRSHELDPETGNFVDLFPALLFSVSEDGRSLITGVPANELQDIQLEGPIAAGEHRVFDVTIDIPESLDNRWQLASTDVRFGFEGESL